MSDPLSLAVVVGLGLVALGLAGNALRTGGYRSSGIERRAHPVRFWFNVSWQVGIGLFCLHGAFRMLSDPRSKRAAPDVCADYGSAFDCFMGERFAALVGVVLAIGLPLGAWIWRRYQRRALDQIMR